MRYVPSALVAIALISACGGSGRGGKDDEPVELTLAPPPPRLQPPSIRPADTFLVAADPKLDGFDGWPLEFEVVAGSYRALDCRVIVRRAGSELASLPGTLADNRCTATWTGRAATGAFIPPGVVDVSAELRKDGTTLAQTQAQAEIVRLGLSQIRLAAPPGAQHPLLFPRRGGTRGSFAELAITEPQWRVGPDRTETGATALDLASGMPRPLPAPWDDFSSPPLEAGTTDGLEHDTFNLPAAFTAGAAVQVIALMPMDVAAPTIADLRIVPPEGMMLTSGDGSWAPGTTITLDAAVSLVPSVGRYDQAVTWRFQALTATGDWVDVPGQLVTTHRLYGLAGAPTFMYTSVPHRAWVDVVDQVTQWVGGTTADPAMVAARIVEGVYREHGLQYDRESGASAYTDYPSGWTGAVFDLSAYQLRTLGRIINCSDAASIVSTYANMVGVDLRYHILTHRFATGFDLNYIKAIGWTEFDETPFFGDRGAFRYHAVVGPSDGSIYDATLALDGDGTPTAAPFTELLAQGMTQIAYLTALSSEPANIRSQADERVRIR